MTRKLTLTCIAASKVTGGGQVRLSISLQFGFCSLTSLLISPTQ
jgi:hypothetical protein